MVIHVGFTTTIETLSTYNTETSEEEIIDLPLKLSKFNDVEIYTLLGAILAKAKNIGCVCLCLDVDISNDTRKEIFSHAHRLGIHDLTFINHATAMYLDITHQQQITPEVGEYIWIQYETCFLIWEQIEEGTRFVTTWESTEMLENTTHPPNIFISWINEDINGEVIKEVYPNCKTYIFIDYCTSRGALIKAKIMANKETGLRLKASNIETRSYNLKTAKTTIITTKENAPLPLKESAEINYLPGSILKVCYGNNIDYLKLPETEQFYINFSINESGIYSIKYLDVNNKTLQPEEDDAKMESIFTFTFLDYMVHKVIVANNALQSVSLKNDSNDDTAEIDITLEKLNNMIKNLLSLEYARSFKPLSQYYLPKKIHAHDPNIEAVGIDLGTTRCFAFVNRERGIEPVALDNTGQYMLPSYVTIEKDDDICGEYGMRKMKTNAKGTIFDSKRLIGKKYDEIMVDKNWPFDVYDDGDRILIGIHNEKENILIPPLIVSGSLLAHIKQKIEEFQGKESKEIVITTPTAFTHVQNIETVLAGILCDWDRVHLLPEPLAAAFAYFIDRTLPINSHLLLFDLGGGTLDAALLKVTNDYIQIENTAGDSFLGGRDFDNILINHVQKKLEENFDIVINNDLKKYKLMEECQKLKHDLTSSDKGLFNVSEINIEKEGIITISRAEFEAMALPLLTKIEDVVKNALRDHKHCRIEKVLLAGGGSRMPLIERLLRRCFPNAELCKEENPEQVVAKGAAYYAYYIAKHSKGSLKNDNKKKKDCLVM